jgi:serine protease AprX
VPNPEPGTWRLEIRGANGLVAAPGVTSPQQLAAPGPVDGNVTQVRTVFREIPDIQGHPGQQSIETAIAARLIDVYADGTFRPDSIVTREELARSLALNTSLRQVLGTAPKFSDTPGDLRLFSEYITARGSTNRDFDFVPTGMVGFTGTAFNPSGSVSRLDLAVAFVKAIGRDAEARALANTTITSGGVALTDNMQVPGQLRGYVQIAIDKGIFEAYPRRSGRSLRGSSLCCRGLGLSRRNQLRGLRLLQNFSSIARCFRRADKACARSSRGHGAGQEGRAYRPRGRRLRAPE